MKSLTQVKCDVCGKSLNVGLKSDNSIAKSSKEAVRYRQKGSMWYKCRDSNNCLKRLCLTNLKSLADLYKFELNITYKDVTEDLKDTLKSIKSWGRSYRLYVDCQRLGL